MKHFLIGVVVTLAVLYPAVTKNLFGQVVDTAHAVTTNILENNQ
jgi:hypothetical protein